MSASPVDFLGLPVRAARREEFVSWLVARPPRPVFATYLNAANFNLACKDPGFAESLRASDFLYADGWSIVAGSRLAGGPIPERLSAADYIDEVLARCAAQGVSPGLIGGKPGVAAKFAQAARERHPSLDIRLCEHGYFPQDGTDALCDRVRDADPGLVLIGMGSPLQEALARKLASQPEPRVIWCVGALFEYHAGRRRAPEQMRRWGLEWLFRLALEPRRLAGRYLLGNPAFIARVIARRRVP